MAAVYGSQRLSGDAVFGAQGAADNATTYIYAVSGGFVMAGAAATSLTSGAVGPTTWSYLPSGGLHFAGRAATEGPSPPEVMAPQGWRRYVLREQSANFPRMQ
jgi:hypothetical protein